MRVEKPNEARKKAKPTNTSSGGSPPTNEDFAEEAAPKKSEFSTEADAKAMTDPPFELIP